MKLLAVFTIFIIFYETNAHPRLCGAKLDSAMLTICGPTGFNTRLKKSVGLIDRTDLLDPNDPMAAIADIFLSEEANMLAKIRRRREGIADECCKLKGCSFNELYSYCKGEERQMANV